MKNLPNILPPKALVDRYLFILWQTFLPFMAGVYSVLFALDYQFYLMFVMLLLAVLPVFFPVREILERVR